MQETGVLEQFKFGIIKYFMLQVNWTRPLYIDD